MKMKSIVIGIVLLAVIILTIFNVRVQSWKPDQHIGMGSIVLEDLLAEGNVTINGIDYEVQPV